MNMRNVFYGVGQTRHSSRYPVVSKKSHLAILEQHHPLSAKLSCLEITLEGQLCETVPLYPDR